MPASSSRPADTAAPARALLSTAQVTVEQRLDYWLELVCAFYCKLDCEPPKDRAIFGSIEFSRVGDLHLTRLKSNGLRVWRSPQRVRAETDDHCIAIVAREGRLVVRQDDREALVQPGDFVFHDCTRPYELLFDATGHGLFVLRLPRTLLDSHVGNLEALTATTVPGQGAAGRLLCSMIETLYDDIGTLHPSSALGVSEAITSVIGAGLRSLPGANLRKPSNITAYHLARIKAHVHEHLRDPDLSVGAVAAAVGLSQDHVSKLFRGEGLSLPRLIWQLRLDACRRELCDPRQAHRTVCDIAYSWGYNDATHFSRSFREQFGLSPREWRQQESALQQGSRAGG